MDNESAALLHWLDFKLIDGVGKTAILGGVGRSPYRVLTTRAKSNLLNTPDWSTVE
jgi:hypothetical protein